ncbi:nitroreductase [Solihabitans fulvus]|uniref:Nitroreductase n=1 Tax=Solihabitans fulvus TaxID=1892852 RepID=A0A5B2XHC0_9PSEU|nr:nitroreductase [Solihabitans fulvus]
MPVHPLIADRWSPRALDPGAEVPLEHLRALFEAARWAASHGNTQPGRYLVGRRGDDTFQRIFSTLRPGNQSWAGSAGALLLGMVRTVDKRGPIPNAEYGLGLAVQNLVLQAVSLGLVTHQMGGFDREAVHAAFDLPPDVRPVVVVAIGTVGDVEDLPEDLRGREVAGRLRRPLGELVFTGEWGTPAFE